MYGGSLNSCTIAGNQGNAGYSGGVYNRAINTNSVIINNTILYGNVAGVYSNYYLSATGPAAFSNCCFAPALSLPNVISNSSANVIADPRFVDAAGSNYHLRGSSPCLNTGLYQDWMTGAVDLDGEPRIRYGRVDMGCYEAELTGTILLVY